MKSVLMEFWDEVLEPLLGGMDKDIKAISQNLKDTNDRLEKLDNRVESGFSDTKRQLNDLKIDTPTQKEFTDLKKRVDHLEQFSLPN